MVIDTRNLQMKFEYNGPEIEDIKRCLSTLYTTRAGQQPLDRNFGLDCTFVGMPIDVAQNMFTLEVIEKTEVYEPRAEVLEVTFNVDELHGKLEPVILIGIKEGGESDERY